MDAFVGLLDGPRARGAFALRTVMSPPWSLRILAEAPLPWITNVDGPFDEKVGSNLIARFS